MLQWAIPGVAWAQALQPVWLVDMVPTAAADIRMKCCIRCLGFLKASATLSTNEQNATVIAVYMTVNFICSRSSNHPRKLT
jgi:hypothetical protein